ncbi:MAG: LTA synthase family protein [Flavipsychrobacter sp.]
MKRLPVALRYIFSIYLIGILFFFVFRLVLVLNNLHAVVQLPGSMSLMLRAFFMGFRFDTVISGYMLALPAVILFIAELGRFLSRGLLLTIHVFICLLYVICFFGCSADIPFYYAFSNRLNITILNWTDSPKFMMKMVVQEWSYLIYFFMFLVLSVLYIFIVKKVYNKSVARLRNTDLKKGFVVKFIASIVALGLMFLGIRGRVEKKSPIMIGTAYFSDYDFPNQVGLNPMFTFIHSYLETLKEENKKLNLMADSAAIKLTQHELHIMPAKYNELSPIARNETYEEAPEKHNVIIVLMESMSAYYTGHTGNPNQLTPNLDSLADHGYYFSNFYSAGIHTFNGIFSTVFSFPALLARHTMVGSTIPKYTGLPYVMKKNGYETMYFTTHDAQFDNVGGFMKANNVDRVVSSADYPADAVVSALGVPDHFMFDYSISIFNSYYEQHKPFFAVLMTGSNHAPYVVPDNIPFKPKHLEVRDGAVEYADWAIGRYMDSLSKQPWFNNTIFVFVADHGTFEDNGYPGLPSSLNHIPFIIYSPLLKDAPKVINNVGGQIDVFPTICGLLHFYYTNNTMGVDLLHDKRPYIYFSADDKIAVADTSMLFLWNKNGAEGLYRLKEQRTDILSAHIANADSMKNYAFSMLQTTQWMLLNNKTGPVL